MHVYEICEEKKKEEEEEWKEEEENNQLNQNTFLKAMLGGRMKPR